MGRAAQWRNRLRFLADADVGRAVEMPGHCGKALSCLSLYAIGRPMDSRWAIAPTQIEAPRRLASPGAGAGPGGGHAHDAGSQLPQ